MILSVALILLSVLSYPVVAVAGDEVEPGRTKPVIRAPIMVAGDVSAQAAFATHGQPSMAE
jgi:hypothetical protein